MKRTTYVCSTLLIAAKLLMTSSFIHAAEVGYVNFERLLYGTPAGKQAAITFQKELEQKQGEIDRERERLQQAAAELESQANNLEPQDLKILQESLQQQYTTLEQTHILMERDLKERRSKLLEQMIQKAAPIIKDVARQKGITIVIDESAVIYAEDFHDMNPELSRRMQ